MIFLKSTVFNLCFFGVTAIACILCLPGLLLPKKQAMCLVYAFVGWVYFFERTILGLNYEVKGIENIPTSGSFIVAAKHQSAYETLKLHKLFKDPAIVLKKELLNIPLWGAFLAKIDPIAIDRSQGKSAIKQIIEGAIKVKSQGRPIIIFPQGTRVQSNQSTKEKPYKVGVAKIHKETNMPIIPLALNSGLYWPKNSWLKKGGTVVFEFLPPIHSDNISELMTTLEETLENKSKELSKV
jgi:1-acyl-sn-glycerol-3-phosphate acyltransferase